MPVQVGGCSRSQSRQHVNEDALTIFGEKSPAPQWSRPPSYSIEPREIVADRPVASRRTDLARLSVDLAQLQVDEVTNCPISTTNPRPGNDGPDRLQLRVRRPSTQRGILRRVACAVEAALEFGQMS